jgi:hypothetical protein
MAVRIVRQTTMQASTKPPHITQSFHTQRLGIPGHCIQAVLRNVMALAIRNCDILHTISSRAPSRTLAAGILVAETKQQARMWHAAAAGPSRSRLS